MEISEAWLREYANPPISTEELVEQLTMAGLEVESVKPSSAAFSGVVVGQVIAMQAHPDADRLRICEVNVGEPEPLQIVCGATNVRVGLKIPAALIGANLPGDFKIKKSQLRGVESYGMLCSVKELGLSSDADGLFELATDAPVGIDIRHYLALEDSIIEMDLTPNRADCLSVEGIAREIAALNKIEWSAKPAKTNEISHSDKLEVNVEASDACPRYLGRLIKNVNATIESPLWMKERLRRSGIRSLGPLVDITNYILLELGQPLHAFDAGKLNGNIHVRWSKANETLTLLNGQQVNLNNETLIIADDQKPLALAGVMGGLETAVNEETQDIFLECAFFAPQLIAGKARFYGLHTDSSHRFERGVDATLQERAIERATQLIIEIAGGSAGPITHVTNKSAIPVRSAIFLRQKRIEKILGVELTDSFIKDTFHRLGMSMETQNDGWLITPPGFRFDIAIEADLIEEIARIYGYNKLPNSRILMRSELGKSTESLLELDRTKDLLVDRGYQEAITYSFVDEEIQKAIAPLDEAIRLKNPISSDLSVMRSTLWSGLLKAALHNINRQQTRVRLFESGLRFVKHDGAISQQKMLAGLALGDVFSEQWSSQARNVDFFDVKADVQAMFTLAGFNPNACDVVFTPARHSALHPGQSAEILNNEGNTIGWLGMLHPSLEQKLGFNSPVFLFELDQNLLLKKQAPVFKPLSKYPSVRRDLALIVKEEISVGEIIGCIKGCSEHNMQDIFIFDVYRGKGVEEGYKSIALSIIIQDFSQTLTDSEIDAIFNRVLKTLADTIGAKLRD